MKGGKVKRYAVLDFSDVEQRLITLNKIEDRQQEDLLKWKEEYNTAQVDLDATKRYQVPAPTKNAYWKTSSSSSSVKYFRGDDRKILKWGLDLSGGKTVRIGLKHQHGKPVTNPDDLNQAVNELYTRIKWKLASVPFALKAITSFWTPQDPKDVGYRPRESIRDVFPYCE